MGNQIGFGVLLVARRGAGQLLMRSYRGSRGVIAKPHGVAVADDCMGGLTD